LSDHTQGLDELADAIALLAFGLVAITARAIDEIRPGRALTFQQWRILVVLGSTDDGCRTSEVAGRIGASRPSTSRLVHRMIERGLVESGVDPSDRRAARLRLTETGVDLLGRVLGIRRRLIAETLATAELDGIAGPDVRRLALAFEQWV
jgi:DNA-binding MarR family transcriptional regulator